MKRFSAFFVILAGIFWGSSCLFVTYLNHNTALSSFQVTAIRLTIAAIVLNVMLIVKGKGFSLYRISVRSLLWAVASGLISVFIMCATYYLCILQTSAAVASILISTSPIFVMIMSVFLFGERITVKKVCALCIAVLGCVLVSGIGSDSSVNTIGILLGLVAGFTYSLYGIFTSFYMKDRKNNALTFTAINFAVASVASLLVSKPWQIVAITAQASNIPLLLLIYLLLSLCTAVFPFYLYTKGLEGVKPDVASILALSEPMTSCAFGVLVLHQPLTPLGGIGIACIFAALIILNIKSKKNAS